MVISFEELMDLANLFKGWTNLEDYERVDVIMQMMLMHNGNDFEGVLRNLIEYFNDDPLKYRDDTPKIIGEVLESIAMEIGEGSSIDTKSNIWEQEIESLTKSISSPIKADVITILANIDNEILLPQTLTI